MTHKNLRCEINRLFAEKNNYLIEYSEQICKSVPYCIAYFSSDDIYYPDSLGAFNEQLVRRDRYEWFNTRISCGTKHIFLRDIRKRHYLTGVNRTLDSVEKMVDFLKEETNGYDIITVGSSSGGYAAILFGQKLNAKRIYSFNGQFVLDVNYVLFREIEKSIIKKYYDLRDFMNIPSRIFYFYSNKSEKDRSQFKLVENLGIQAVSFNTNIHGIPFLKCNLPIVLNLNTYDLKNLTNRRHNPLIFSIEMVGMRDTLMGACNQFREMIRDSLK